MSGKDEGETDHNRLVKNREGEDLASSLPLSLCLSMTHSLSGGKRKDLLVGLYDQQSANHYLKLANFSPVFFPISFQKDAIIWRVSLTHIL